MGQPISFRLFTGPVGLVYIYISRQSKFKRCYNPFKSATVRRIPLAACRLLNAMDPGKLGDILKHLEKQNELLKKASESVIQELSNLQAEEEMMMRKYYAIMSEHGKVKKVHELHNFWQQHGHGRISTHNETGNSTALVTVTRKEEN